MTRECNDWKLYFSIVFLPFPPIPALLVWFCFTFQPRKISVIYYNYYYHCSIADDGNTEDDNWPCFRIDDSQAQPPLCMRQRFEWSPSPTAKPSLHRHPAIGFHCYRADAEWVNIHRTWEFSDPTKQSCSRVMHVKTDRLEDAVAEEIRHLITDCNIFIWQKDMAPE